MTAEHDSDKKKVYLVTGAAGFIGYFLSVSLLNDGCRVVGIDIINDYYDMGLKYERLDQLKRFERFTFLKEDISDKSRVIQAFCEYKPDIAINLAAQAGVRYSLENPDAYIKNNISGFYNILEACRQHPVGHLVYASSSSVYGLSSRVPFSETDITDSPASLYAATKKSNELMAYTYSHLYKIPATGLRFFTVYGPYGRPDMAYFDFTNRYFAGEPIKVFNNGDTEHDLYRDFTYIDDIVEGIKSVINDPPAGTIPNKIYNIGNNAPVKLTFFIETLEKCLARAIGKDVVFDKVYMPAQPGDVPMTYASIDLLQQAAGFKPKTTIEEGLQKFADWYVDYYHIRKMRN